MTWSVTNVTMNCTTLFSLPSFSLVIILVFENVKFYFSTYTKTNKNSSLNFMFFHIFYIYRQKRICVMQQCWFISLFLSHFWQTYVYKTQLAQREREREKKRRIVCKVKRAAKWKMFTFYGSLQLHNCNKFQLDSMHANMYALHLCCFCCWMARLASIQWIYVWYVDFTSS